MNINSKKYKILSMTFICNPVKSNNELQLKFPGQIQLGHSFLLTQTATSGWSANVAIWASANGIVIGNPAVCSRGARVVSGTWVDAVSIFACRVIGAVVVIRASSRQGRLGHKFSYMSGKSCFIGL